ncbi:Hpt domain-containing protein [Tranquillimonas alkanivorans]|uniref:Hpt domain-containing protein n=1 Tax=Tranquillimonas alkanivorans TaxID=441119 RepID=A0A1I5Q8M2_9RHOB|nr:Hpt domain-containing protein [Tranquillimonas alkanivorans]SFP42497.1 Hpt domain-containing protein [Tranquillimonas alkanivorans]
MLAENDASGMMDGTEMSKLPALLRPKFIRRLADGRERMETQLHRLRDGSAEASDLRELQGEAHRIAGIAGALGYPALGNIAARTDSILGRMLAEKDPGPDVTDAVRHVDVLNRAISTVLRTTQAVKQSA